MPAEPIPPNGPKSLDQLLAEAVRENERLRRQLADAHHERDEFKRYFLEEMARNAPEITQEQLDNAPPLQPLIEKLIARLEKQ